MIAFKSFYFIDLGVFEAQYNPLKIFLNSFNFIYIFIIYLIINCAFGSGNLIQYLL